MIFAFWREIVFTGTEEIEREINQWVTCYPETEQDEKDVLREIRDNGAYVVTSEEFLNIQEEGIRYEGKKDVIVLIIYGVSSSLQLVKNE